MDIVISPYVYGGHKYIVKTTSGVSFKETAPKDTILLEPHDISAIEKLYCDNFPKFPPENYKNVYNKTLGRIIQENIQWEYCIPTKKYYTLLIKYINDISSYLESHNLEYYITHHKRFTETLRKLVPAKINTIKLAVFSQNALPAQKTLLDTFRKHCTAQGYSLPPVYSLTGTRTGRMSVVDGSNILQLKKEYRSILTSSFGKDGNIWYLDYSALEPRVLLSVSTTTPLYGKVPQDIYLDILSRLNLTGKIPRDIIKLVVISILYGQTEKATEEQIKDYTDDPIGLIDAVMNYFGGVDELKQKLSQELAINDYKYVSSFYGRPVVCEEQRSSVLLNNYIQSTAVTVALLGFSQIIERIYQYGIQDIICPLMVLHDALILDIHKDAEHIISKLERLGSTGIPGFKDVDFFLRSEILL